jgi:hypothetical protein
VISCDVHTVKAVGSCPGHKGHVTVSRWLEASTIVTGGHEGTLRIYDIRAKQKLCNLPSHVRCCLSSLAPLMHVLLLLLLLLLLFHVWFGFVRTVVVLFTVSYCTHDIYIYIHTHTQHRL